MFFNMANRSASASATKAVLIMVVAGTMIFTLPTVMVLTVGMIPTFIAYATDRRKEKYKTVSVGSLNFVGVLPLLVTLWTKDHSFDMGFTVLSDPFNWLMVLGSSSAGWTIYLVAPSIVSIFLQARIELSVERLKKRQARLIEEWGEGVSGDRKLNQKNSNLGNNEQGDVRVLGLNELSSPPYNSVYSFDSKSWVLMFFCNFSKAFTSTCRTRSRLIPNSEPSSSSVAAFSDNRRFWIIYCSLGFNVFHCRQKKLASFI